MEHQPNTIPEGHITLKEAARISGYAPDYVGQLIRKGKLYGRQVYLNTAWVTTEEAMRKYVAGEVPTGAATGSPELGEKFQQAKNVLLSDVRVSGIVRIALYAVLGLAVVFSLVLFYVVSVNIERVLTERAVERATEGERTAP
jgi:hypothetical protein